MRINKKQFVFNAGSGFLSQFAFAGVGLILTPYILRKLGVEGYGVFQLATSALVFFGYLQLGMGPTMVRYCSQAIAKNDYDEIRKICSTAQLILGSMGLVGMCIIMAFSPVFLKFYHVPPEMTLGTSGLLYCMAISLLLNMLVIVPSGILLGSNRYDLANGIEIISNLFRLGLIVATFELIGRSLLMLGICMLAAQLLRFLLFFVFALKVVGHSILFSIHSVKREKITSLLSFSSLNLIHSIANYGVIQGPVLIIGRTLGVGVVSSLAPAILVATSTSNFLGQMSRPLVPLASKAHIESNYEALGRWAIIISCVLSVIGLAIVLPISVFGKEIVGLWLGLNMSNVWLIIVILTLGANISQPAGVIYSLALGGGDVKPSVYSQVVVAIVTTCGAAIGTYWFGWQLLEVVLLISVCWCIRSAFYLTFAYSRSFSYSLPRYFRVVYAKPVITFVLVIGIGFLMKKIIGSSLLPVLAIELSAIILLYSAAAWRFLLPDEIKLLFKK